MIVFYTVIILSLVKTGKFEATVRHYQAKKLKEYNVFFC